MVVIKVEKKGKTVKSWGYESFIRIATPVIDPILGEVFQ